MDDHAVLVKALRDMARLERVMWDDPTGLGDDELKARPMHLVSADILTQAADTIQKLETAIEVQARAVRRLDLKERAEYLATESLESEREMNAKLTAEVEHLTRQRDRLARALSSALMDASDVPVPSCETGTPEEWEVAVRLLIVQRDQARHALQLCLSRLEVATNDLCSCGGMGPNDLGCCAACRAYHQVKGNG